MKKVFAFILSLAFVLSMMSVSFAQTIQKSELEWYDNDANGPAWHWGFGWTSAEFATTPCLKETLAVIKEKITVGSVQWVVGDKGTDPGAEIRTGLYFMADGLRKPTEAWNVTTALNEGYFIEYNSKTGNATLYKVDSYPVYTKGEDTKTAVDAWSKLRACEKTSLTSANVNTTIGFNRGANSYIGFKVEFDAQGKVVFYACTTTWDHTDGHVLGYNDMVKILEYTPASGASVPDGNRVAFSSLWPSPWDSGEFAVFMDLKVNCTHDLTHHEAVAPTCTEDGTVEYWSCECGGIFSDIDGKNAINTTVDPKTGHDMSEHAANAPTCTGDGNVKYYSCNNCKKNFADIDGNSILDSVVDPSTGHVMTHYEAKDATCLERGNVEYWACSECGYNYDAEQGGNIIQNVETEATGHNMTHFEAIAPDCITDGNVEYWHCENCGNNYADDAKDSENELDSVIDPKLGHDMIHNDRVAPTCTEPGTKEFWTCKNCNKNFADKDGNEVIVNLGISALGHDLIHHESTSTCMEAGNGEYWECGECGLLFADEDAEQEINEIPAGEINDKHVNTIDDATVGHDEYSHWYECECGDILDTNEHDEAGENGACSVCGYKAPAADTGDMTAIIAIVAIVAALGCGVVFTVSRKRI